MLHFKNVEQREEFTWMEFENLQWFNANDKGLKDLTYLILPWRVNKMFHHLDTHFKRTRGNYWSYHSFEFYEKEMYRCHIDKNVLLLCR